MIAERVSLFKRRMFTKAQIENCTWEWQRTELNSNNRGVTAPREIDLSVGSLFCLTCTLIKENNEDIS